jgi:hypothetical protein
LYTPAVANLHPALEREWIMKRVQPLEYDPVIHGYSVATVNKYDVYSIKDVVKILKWIHHEDTSEEYVREFSKKLIAFDIFTRMRLNAEGINIKGKVTADKLVKLGVIPKRRD